MELVLCHRFAGVGLAVDVFAASGHAGLAPETTISKKIAKNLAKFALRLDG